MYKYNINNSKISNIYYLTFKDKRKYTKLWRFQVKTCKFDFLDFQKKLLCSEQIIWKFNINQIERIKIMRKFTPN